MKSGCFSVLAVLVVHQLLHEQVVDTIQLLVAVQRAQQLLAVLRDGFQNDQTEFLRLGLVLVLVYRGEK